MSSINLSKEYGVNPSVDHCFICGKDYGIVLFGAGYKVNGKTAQAPSDVCTGHLCDECKKAIENGVRFVIECENGSNNESASRNRTGRYVGVSEDFFKRNNINGNLIFMERSMFEHIFGETFKGEGNNGNN